MGFFLFVSVEKMSISDMDQHHHHHHHPVMAFRYDKLDVWMGKVIVITVCFWLNRNSAWEFHWNWHKCTCTSTWIELVKSFFFSTFCLQTILFDFIFLLSYFAGKMAITLRTLGVIKYSCTNIFRWIFIHFPHWNKLLIPPFWFSNLYCL